jgi:hypothetical protein
MKLANETNLNRKSGVAQWRDLLFLSLGPSFREFFPYLSGPARNKAQTYVVGSPVPLAIA